MSTSDWTKIPTLNARNVLSYVIDTSYTESTERPLSIYFLPGPYQTPHPQSVVSVQPKWTPAQEMVHMARGQETIVSMGIRDNCVNLDMCWYVLKNKSKLCGVRVICCTLQMVSRKL